MGYNFFPIRIMFVDKWNGEEYIAIARPKVELKKKIKKKCIIASIGRQRGYYDARHEEIIYYCNLCEKCATIRIA